MVTKNSAAYWLGSSSDVPEMLMVDVSQDFILLISHISCMHMFLLWFVSPKYYVFDFSWWNILSRTKQGRPFLVSRYVESPHSHVIIFGHVGKKQKPCLRFGYCCFLAFPTIFWWFKFKSSYLCIFGHVRIKYTNMPNATPAPPNSRP